jgi:hypothetical protein
VKGCLSFIGAAAAEIQVLLRKLTPLFGYDENNTANYNTKFHNRVLTQFSGCWLQIYASQGVEGVVVEDENLKRRG